MIVTAVKLVDLIERGRAPPAEDQAVARDRAEREQTESERLWLTQPQPATQEPIAKDIELLAVRLYSISRLRGDNPGDLMREALRSIESCLVAIRRQH